MMSTTFESRRLPATFTFRIVEAVKRIKIHPMPRVAGLPWGLSLAAGIMVAVMTIGSQMAIYEKLTPLTFSSETETLKAREIAVDILGAPGTSVMAGKQGDTDGVAMDQRSPERNSLLAPAKGGGTWTQKADMPTARYCVGAAVVDGKIYVIGGVTGSYMTTPAVEVYDPTTNTWTRKADMPTTTGWLSTSVVDGIIYAIGGWSNWVLLTSVEAYDPATGKWTRKASMPTQRDALTTSVVDGKIYAIGGMVARQGAPVAVSTVEVYDPATDRWTRKADMPTAREFHAACVVDGRIYVSGGNTTRPIEVALKTVDVYDPATDTWTQGSDMPWPRWGHSASVVDGKMYIIGGTDPELFALWVEGKEEGKLAEELFPSVDVYDPRTDTWTEAADFPNVRDHVTAVVVDGRIYTIGGCRGIDNPLSMVEEYGPGLPDSISVTSPAGKLLRTWGEVKFE